MAAPAGVNDGLPQEPAEAGVAQAEVVPAQAGAPVDEQGPTAERLAEATPTGEEPEEAGARGEGRDVGPLTIVGIIVGVIALVGVAVGVLAIVTHGFRPKTVVTYRPAAVFELRPGQCVNTEANGIAVKVLPCPTPHDAEVFATFRLPGSSWPGTGAVRQDAGNGCASRFGSYLNPQLAEADLAQEFVYPNRNAWQAGERTVICEVRSASGQLTGSVGQGS